MSSRSNIKSRRCTDVTPPPSFVTAKSRARALTAERSVDDSKDDALCPAVDPAGPLTPGGFWWDFMAGRALGIAEKGNFPLWGCR